MTSPATVEQPTPTPSPRLVHCICGGCNPDVTLEPLTRPTTALCGHVCPVGAGEAEGADGVRCLVCDDLQFTHVCQEDR